MKKLTRLSYLAIAVLVFLCSIKQVHSQTKHPYKTAVFNGTKTIGASGADYTSITAALSAANSAGLDGPVIFSLQADYTSSGETFPLTIGNISGSSVTNTITIRPAATGLIITSSNTTATINFDGGKYVTIDGRVDGVGSTKDLVITNTSTATGGTAIRFINDASNNTIKYAKLSSSFGSSTTGIVFFSTTSGSTGNDNNTIDNCDLDGRAGSTASPSSAGVAAIGVFSSGTETTAATYNSGNIISNCNIFDNFNSGSTSNFGVYLFSGNTDWTISGNSFYQTSLRTVTANLIDINVIHLVCITGGNFTITNNYIGGTQANAGGTALTINGSFTTKFRGISLSANLSNPSSIQGNIIRNINFSTSSNASTVPGIFAGIYFLSGSANIGTSVGNIIGNATGTGNIVTTTSGSGAITYGICSGAPSSVLTISNNTIGSINIAGSTSTISSGFTGIANNVIATTVTISGNTIGSTSTSNSINAITAATTSAAQIITGISNTGSGTYIISNNTIANLNNDYSPSSAVTNSVIRGIFNSSGSLTISGNTIRNLKTAARATGSTSAVSVAGIINTSTTSSLTISQNIVHSLANLSTSNITQVVGIYNAGPTSGTNTISRNFIHSLKLSTSAIGIIYGIHIGSGNTSISNNMVRLGIDETGASITNEYNIRGISDEGGTNQYYFNSIYIGGTGVTSGTTNSYAFYSTVINNFRNFQNNIFVNNRSNSSGTGINVAYFISGTVPALTGLTSNNNIYFANGTGGVIIRNSTTNYALTVWRSLTSQDNASHLGNPNFISATGNSSTVNLHLQSPTMAEGGGASISTITDDYDGEVRANFSPTDIGADAGTFTSVDGSPPNISFYQLTSGTTANKTLINFATITDNASVSNTSKPRIYYKKSTENNAFVGNTNADNGWKYVVASNSSSPYSFTIDYALLNSAIANADVIEYFVVAQDASNNFNSLPEGAGFSTNPPVENINAKPSTVYSYTINTATTSGTFNVGSGETYTSLTGTGGLFEFLNTKVFSGNITINITSDLTEDGTVSLNAQGEEPYSSNFTVTIQSNTNAMRTISGTAVATGVPMINFNGADNVIIDGRNAGSGQYLTFRNTNATAANTGATIQFNNECVNTTIRNTIVENNGTSTTMGAIVIGSTGTNNITIQSNEIKDATGGTTGQAYCGIYSNSSTNTANITNNNIYNYSGRGVLLNAAANGCSITNNSFYATTSVTTAIVCITIQTGNNHSITGNYIGGTSSNAGGTPMIISGGNGLTGISSVGSIATANTIQNNTIQNINLTNTGSSGFIGISISSGIVTITGNTIGHATTPNSIQLDGGLGSIGINVATTHGATISNNLIANVTATGTTGNNTLYGIFISGNTSLTISNNIIKNLSSAGSITTTGTARSVCGISVTGSLSNQIITKNTISGLTATHATLDVSCVGMMLSNTAASFIVTKNSMYNLVNNSSNLNASIYGIYIGAGSGTIYNNMVTITNSPNTTDPIIGGISCRSTAIKTNTIYYNTVKIGGTANSTSNTFCLGREVAESIFDVKNNILINKRSGGSGKHYAIYNYSGATGWSASASNYNVLYSSTASTTGYWTTDQTFAGFQTASGGEANSKNVDVTFNDETNGDLHISGASIGNANLKGVLVASITEDFDDQVRPSTSGIPYIGADEVTASPLPIELISFNGIAKTDFNVLTWTTASEINSNYFDVERLNTEKEFERIGRINTAGYSKEINQYQFHDATFNSSNTIEYYRLKMIDRDDHFNYSDIIAVKRNAGVKASVILYPNPSEETLNIIISNADATKIKVKILDLVGKVVYENNNLMSNEINSIETTSFPSGLYTLQVIGLTENINQKFMKK